MCRYCNHHAKITVHHVYGQSRFPELKSVQENKVKIDQLSHSQYHDLFGQRTPEEIVTYLANYFWGGNKDIVKLAISQLQNLL